MKTKSYILWVLSILLLTSTVLMSRSYNRMEINNSEFSYTSSNISSHVNQTFTLSEDADLKFKYAGNNLGKNTSITLTNLDTGKEYLYFGDKDNSEIILKSLPQGKYHFGINYTSGQISCNFYTSKSKK